jgi:imidazole glycerol-phosphate synthase subunit HisH
MIAIIDYGMGNVRSVYNALDYLAQDAIITADPRAIDDASHLILPGVGAFGDAMRNLRSRELIEVLNRQVLEKGKPMLGICLGLQLMAKRSSEHGEHAGLGWFNADVERFELRQYGLKIPHMGWNKIVPEVKHPLFQNLKDEEFTFYFVHSYHIGCRDQGTVAATCCYGDPFTAAIFKDNIFATQFHPEKSQDNGIQVLKNFASWNS